MKNTLPLTSFPMHFLFTYEWYYQIFAYVTCGVLLLFKCYNLPYTSAMSAQQTILLIIFFLITMLRIWVGRTSNKTQNSDSMVLFIILTLICIFGCFYFIFLQYYVLLLDIIFNAITAVTILIQIILGFTLFWQFKIYEKST